MTDVQEVERLRAELASAQRGRDNAIGAHRTTTEENVGLRAQLATAEKERDHWESLVQDALNKRDEAQRQSAALREALMEFCATIARSEVDDTLFHKAQVLAKKALASNTGRGAQIAAKVEALASIRAARKP